MKRSDIEACICQARSIFEECSQKFDKAADDFQNCSHEHQRISKQLIKDAFFHRQDAAFCALNALMLGQGYSL